jgi:hypothetical protein
VFREPHPYRVIEGLNRPTSSDRPAVGDSHTICDVIARGTPRVTDVRHAAAALLLLRPPPTTTSDGETVQQTAGFICEAKRAEQMHTPE